MTRSAPVIRVAITAGLARFWNSGTVCTPGLILPRAVSNAIALRWPTLVKSRAWRTTFPGRSESGSQSSKEPTPSRPRERTRGEPTAPRPKQATVFSARVSRSRTPCRRLWSSSREAIWSSATRNGQPSPTLCSCVLLRTPTSIKSRRSSPSTSSVKTRPSRSRPTRGRCSKETWCPEATSTASSSLVWCIPSGSRSSRYHFVGFSSFQSRFGASSEIRPRPTPSPSTERSAQRSWPISSLRPKPPRSLPAKLCSACAGASTA